MLQGVFEGSLPSFCGGCMYVCIRYLVHMALHVRPLTRPSSAFSTGGAQEDSRWNKPNRIRCCTVCMQLVKLCSIGRNLVTTSCLQCSPYVCLVVLSTALNRHVASILFDDRGMLA